MTFCVVSSDVVVFVVDKVDCICGGGDDGVDDDCSGGTGGTVKVLVVVVVVDVGTTTDAVGTCCGCDDDDTMIDLGGGIYTAIRCSGRGGNDDLEVTIFVFVLVLFVIVDVFGTNNVVFNFNISSRLVGSSIIRSKA